MGGPGEIEKPVVFVSHATTDQAIATAVKDEIERVFAGAVEVFSSSSPGSIPAGGDWLAHIRRALDRAHAVVVLLTPTSLNRPWLWFEVGASWSAMLDDERRIYPLCVEEIDVGSLPEPLNRLQALSLGKAEQSKQFFETLCEQFGAGSMKGWRHSRLKSRIPRYREVTIQTVDRTEAKFYSGPYAGYSDDELIEVIDEIILDPAAEKARTGFVTRATMWSGALNGELLHYRDIDEKLSLPPGSAQLLLVEAARRLYGIVPIEGEEWEHCVRLRWASRDEDEE